ncbi:protein CHUP1, chloroplastic-like [Magnolia sinica]|uniref:protein CHUP1, chloroplastic-like n=1 Tax=Magnolia sinica TaxID=86752 RepID=UPI00265B043D|nr:protein CHUP1, chloroplastic-like [Magnolia sinica]
MAAGKVKAAMGFQKSPAAAATPKAQTPKRSSFSSSSPISQKAPPPPSQSKTVFGRSFGVYFPRSSAQVQPRPPDVSDLLRLVDELQENESRLKTELLEHKLLKETVAIVPFLENEIASKDAEIVSSAKRIEGLEAENEMLRREVERLKERIEREGTEREKKMKEMEDEIADLRRTAAESKGVESKRICSEIGYIEECSSSSQRFQGLIDASARSNLLKSLRKGTKSSEAAANQDNSPKVEIAHLKVEDLQSRSNSESQESAASSVKSRAPRVPKPPPKPSSSSSSSTSSSSSSSSNGEIAAVEKNRASLERSNLTAMPPAPPPFPGGSLVPGRRAVVPPPPPPPPPARVSNAGAAKVRRVPEVVEFYHSLMRRDSKRDSGAGVSDVPSAANARNMIGEIENRSAHLLAIKTDVETQGDFIRFLIKEVQNAAFTDIEDVVAFVKWLDDELSFLVDERAVLKHFDWPEHKADAMREAAFGYSDLKKLESDASSFRNDVQQPCGPALKKMQSLLEKLEHGAYNLCRMRESATKRYKGFQIPWQWMLETGFVSQIKLASVKLAMKYMKRISAELEAVGGGPEEEELMVQGVRFAFRVHQFAGGFDVETMRAFHELRNKAHSCRHIQGQNPQQQNRFCRSTSC